MRGRDEAADDRFDLVLFGAWRGEAFAREDRLKPLKSYLRKQARAAKAAIRQTAAEIAAALGQRGATVTIVDKPRPRTERRSNRCNS